MTMPLTSLAACLTPVPLAGATPHRNPLRNVNDNALRAVPCPAEVPEASPNRHTVLWSLAKIAAAMIVAFALSGNPEWVYAQPAAAKKDKGTKPARTEEKQLTAEDAAAVEDTIFRLTNIVRKRQGLSPLKSSRALVFLARHHSRDMCRTGTFTHESDNFPKGWNRFKERMKLAGLRNGGENIAFRTWTADRKKWAVSIVKGWVHSPPHLKNILDPAFRYVGVGIGRCGRNIGYVTQVFSTEQGKTPDLPRDRPYPRHRTASSAMLTR